MCDSLNIHKNKTRILWEENEMGFNYIPEEKINGRRIREVGKTSKKNSNDIEKLSANLDYVAMMTDVNIESEEEQY